MGFEEGMAFWQVNKESKRELLKREQGEHLQRQRNTRIYPEQGRTLPQQCINLEREGLGCWMGFCSHLLPQPSACRGGILTPWWRLSEAEGQPSLKSSWSGVRAQGHPSAAPAAPGLLHNAAGTPGPPRGCPTCNMVLIKRKTDKQGIHKHEFSIILPSSCWCKKSWNWVLTSHPIPTMLRTQNL